MQREKHTKSGPLLEIDFYSIWANGRRLPSRAPKTKETSEEQKKYNRTVAMKKLVRLVNANFDSSDYFMHPTYEPSKAPQDEKAARRDIVNYLRRVKSRREREAKRLKKELKQAEKAAEALPDNEYLAESVKGLKGKIAKLSKPMKYIYVIEKQTYKSGKHAGRVNWHFHLFVTGGLDSRTLEEMWTNGLRTNCNHYQPEKFGPEAAGKYMSKDPQGAKRFCYSKNLKKPREKTKDGAVSRLSVERMATERVDDSAFWEKRYKGYRFLRCYSRFNEYNGRWYVSVVMYKTKDDGDLPEWKEDEWLTSDYA